MMMMYILLVPRRGGCGVIVGKSILRCGNRTDGRDNLDSDVLRDCIAFHEPQVRSLSPQGGTQHTRMPSMAIGCSSIILVLDIAT